MSKDDEYVFECPGCKRWVSTIAYTSLRFNYQCACRKYRYSDYARRALPNKEKNAKCANGETQSR